MKYISNLLEKATYMFHLNSYQCNTVLLFLKYLCKMKGLDNCKLTNNELKS